MAIDAGHIAPQGGGFEPQRAYDFEVELYGVPGAGTIRLSMQSAGMPKPVVGQIEINYGAERRKVAGQVNFENQEFTVIDYTDQATFGSLMAWHKLVYDPNSGLVGLASQYKRTGAIIMLDPQGGGSRVYDMQGVWPTRVEGEDLDYTNEDSHKITVELSVDLAIPAF